MEDEGKVDCRRVIADVAKVGIDRPVSVKAVKCGLVLGSAA